MTVEVTGDCAKLFVAQFVHVSMHPVDVPYGICTLLQQQCQPGAEWSLPNDRKGCMCPCMIAASANTNPPPVTAML